MITIALWQDKGEEKVKNDLGRAHLRRNNCGNSYFAIVHRVARYVGHKPVPELGQCPAKSNGWVDAQVMVNSVLISRSEKYTCSSKIKPVLPCVDVEVGEDEGVEGALLRRPLHHRLEPVLQDEQDGKSFARARWQKFCKSRMTKVLPRTFIKPGCICCDSHPWEGPHCPVNSFQV